MKIFCIHTLPEAEGNKKAERMFRTLNVDEYYYLYSGYEIDKDWLDERDRNVRQVVRKKDRNVPDNFFTDTIRNPQGNNISIELCAIVGQNGAGKSSVIELLTRVINNLSAVVLGEYFYAPKSEHIHYIDNVYAEFYYENDHVIYCLGCKGDTVYRYTFNNDQELGNDIFVKDDNEDRSLVLGQNPNGRNQRYDLLLENLFYTIVSNYSLHSYLPSSYMNELTSKCKEFSIRRKGIEEKLFAFGKPHNENGGTRRYAMNDISIEDRLWLTGLFHKNDEYQTPIVITPMRNNGEIDVNNEQDLAMERMLSMLFYEKEGNNVKFNEINDKLVIEGFRLDINKYKEEIYNTCQKAYEEGVNANKAKLDRFLNLIEDSINEEFPQVTKGKQYYRQICINYIKAKMVKVVFTYIDYSDLRNILTGNDVGNVDEELKRGIKRIWEDKSNVTLKIRRTTNYLRYDHIGLNKVFKTEKLCRKMDDVILQNGHAYMPPEKRDDLLPPPIFDVDFLMYAKTDKKRQNRIAFSTLSSGEKQITNTLSAIYYHLINIDTIGNRVNEEQGAELIKYRSVNLIFDEIELYFHPEMQRKFIYSLLNGLKTIPLRHIRNVHIILVTHSPFVLSDIPQQNILFLKKDGSSENSTLMQTFAANIYSMLKSSFFLEDTMGQFASEYIKRIVYMVVDKDTKSIKQLSEADMRRVDEMLNVVQEPLVKQSIISAMVKE